MKSDERKKEKERDMKHSSKASWGERKERRAFGKR